jgi:hypothetical protein
MITLSPDADRTQARLWEEEVELTESFFAALKRHPVPIWEPAIRAISRHSLVLDVYVWLTYRLRAVKKPTLVPWPALKSQFGPEYERLRDFRRGFIRALKQALAVYPDANVTLDEEGLVLKPSRPAVPEKKVLALTSR